MLLRQWMALTSPPSKKISHNLTIVFLFAISVPDGLPLLFVPFKSGSNIFVHFRDGGMLKGRDGTRKVQKEEKDAKGKFCFDALD